jgi:hypothetical protein
MTQLTAINQISEKLLSAYRFNNNLLKCKAEIYKLQGMVLACKGDNYEETKTALLLVDRIKSLEEECKGLELQNTAQDEAKLKELIEMQ